MVRRTEKQAQRAARLRGETCAHLSDVTALLTLSALLLRCSACCCRIAHSRLRYVGTHTQQCNAVQSEMGYLRAVWLWLCVAEVPGSGPSISPRALGDDDGEATRYFHATAPPPPPPVVVSDIPLERLLDREYMETFMGHGPMSTPMHSPQAPRSAAAHLHSQQHHTTPDAGGAGRARSPSVSVVSSPAATAAAPSPRVWIQLSGLSSAPATSAALKAIGAALRIHPVTVSDLQTSNTREKLEVFSEYLFMVVHAVVHPTPTIFDIVHGHREEDEPAAVEQGAAAAAAKRRQRSAAAAAAASYDASLPSTDGDVNPFETDWHPPAPALSGDFRSARVRTAPIHLVVFPHMVLSLHHGHQQSELNSVCRKLHSLAETRMESGQWIVHAIMDAIISSLRPIVDATDSEIDRLEQLIFDQTAASQSASNATAHLEMLASGQLLKRMGLTRRRLLMLQQQLKSKQSLINSLIGRDMSRLSSVQMPYLRDLEDHVADMQAITEGGATMLEALQSTYLSQLQLRAEDMSRKVNDTMKKLSAFATIVLPLSLISGIMGQPQPHRRTSARRERAKRAERLGQGLLLHSSLMSDSF